MFKRIRESERYIKLKELWTNPKTHAMMVLAFWLIFMVVAIVLVRVMSHTSVSTSKVENVATSFANITGYDFTYKTNNEEINGSYYDGAIIFYLNNKRYYYKDNVYLIDDEVQKVEGFDLNVLKLNSKLLNNLVSGITPALNDNFKQYIVPLDRFINLYEVDTDMDLSQAATYNVVVSVYTNNKVINKVVLDSSSYYTMKTGASASYPVTINYYNVNNVSDFTSGYDELIEVKK